MLPRKIKPEIKVVLAIVVLPHFLAPKVLIIFCHCRPLFLARSIFVMDVHVVLTGWMRTGREVLTAHRQNWSAEYIKTVTDWARQHCIAGPIQQHQRQCAALWQGKVTSPLLQYQKVTQKNYPKHGPRWLVLTFGNSCFMCTPGFSPKVGKTEGATKPLPYRAQDFASL